MVHFLLSRYVFNSAVTVLSAGTASTCLNNRFYSHRASKVKWGNKCSLSNTCTFASGGKCLGLLQHMHKKIIVIYLI